jgi:hypothetical protein
MEKPWFKRKGILYIPSSTVGWLLLVLLITYWIYTFIGVDMRTHSVKDTLINFAFNALFGAFVYQIIAYYSSRKSKIPR